MTLIPTIQTQQSPAAMTMRGRMSLFNKVGSQELFAEQLSENILEHCYLVAGKRCHTILQPTFVNGTYLVGSNLAVASHNMTSHTIGVAVNGRCHRGDNYCVKMVVQLLRTDNNTWAYLLHFGTDSWIQVNPEDIKLAYHFQSSIVSSSNTSAVERISSPSICACLAAAAQPTRVVLSRCSPEFVWACSVVSGSSIDSVMNVTTICFCSRVIPRSSPIYGASGVSLILCASAVII